jgi:hypothetical protein
MTHTHQDASLMFSIVGIGTHLDTFKGMSNWNTKLVFHHINMHIDPLLIVNGHHLICI